MRERAEAYGTEQTGQPLQRVHRAEGLVDQRWIADAGLDRGIQAEQISRQSLDDLLRLGEELFARFVGQLSHAAWRGPCHSARSARPRSAELPVRTA